jgi:hypothetical protein
LRKGVKYHNGKELTAEDVALNFDWKINSATYVKERGWKPARARQLVVALKKVEAIDRYIVTSAREVILKGDGSPEEKEASQYIASMFQRSAILQKCRFLPNAGSLHPM